MSARTDRLRDLERAYENIPVRYRQTGKSIVTLARAVADAKAVGASDRECMDALKSRDWKRYKIYKDKAREEGWL